MSLEIRAFKFKCVYFLCVFNFNDFFKNTDIIGLSFDENTIFIFADQTSLISFNQVLISKVLCKKNSYFMLLFGNSTLNLLNSSFISIEIVNTNFMNFTNSSVVFDTIIVENVLVKNLEIGQNQASFIQSNSHFDIFNSLFGSNEIFGYGCLLCIVFDDLSILIINSTVFKNNKGTFSSDYPILLSVFSQSLFSLVQINKVLFLNNNGFEGMFDIQISSGYVYISNLTIALSSINYGVHLQNLKFIEFKHFSCSSINLINTNFSGPCIFFEDSEEIILKYVEIYNNFALSNVPGIIITQNPDYVSGCFFL